MRKWNKYKHDLTQLRFSRKQSKVKVAWSVYMKDSSNIIFSRVDILANQQEYYRWLNSRLYRISPEEFQQFTKVKLFNFKSAFHCIEQLSGECLVYTMTDLKNKSNEIMLVLARDEFLRSIGLEPNHFNSELCNHLEEVKEVLKVNLLKVKRSLYRKYLDDGYVNLNNRNIKRYQNFIVDGDFLYTRKDTFTILSYTNIKVDGEIVARNYKCENNISIIADKASNNNFVAKVLHLGSKTIYLEPKDRVFYLLSEKKKVVS